MFFDSWLGLLRIVVVGTLAYGGLVLVLRVSGKRTLSKMNAFDLIVTVALGSTLATIILSKDVALLEGLLALVLLVSLQLLVTWLSVRSDRFQSIVKAEPRLLMHHGRMLRAAMIEERVTLEEIRAALRAQGFSTLDQAAAVVLETDGTISALGEEAESRSGSTLGNLTVRPGASDKSIPSNSL